MHRIYELPVSWIIHSPESETYRASVGRLTATPSQRLKKTREQPAQGRRERETGKGRDSPDAGRERYAVGHRAGAASRSATPGLPPTVAAYRRFFARAFVGEAAAAASFML